MYTICKQVHLWTLQDSASYVAARCCSSHYHVALFSFIFSIFLLNFLAVGNSVTQCVNDLLL